jgi:NADPH:quinone reductase-like Zn-dependent oxidoreductase
MKAVQLLEYGEPARVLAVRELPLPDPQTGEVRVRMLATPVNPSDLLFVRGIYAGVQPPRFPASVGFEGVGAVDALGPEVQGPAVGARVLVQNGRGGNWAEYAVVPADTVFSVPDDLPDEQIACMLINPASAVLMLRHVLAVPRGEWLLQSAATSELGRMMIKLAKHDGVRTVNVVRRREAVAELKRLGADAVVVSTEGPIDEQVRKIVGPAGVRYAIDPVVGETGTQLFQALGEEGRMLVYGSLTREPIRVGADPRTILAGRRILEVFWLGYWLPRLDGAERQRLLDEIVALIRQGVLGTTIGRRYPLDEVAAAVAQSETKGRSGKVLLVPERVQTRAVSSEG